VSRLPDIQDAFQRFLLTGEADIESAVIGTERVPTATRLAIYSEGYRSRLIEALQASFPVLADLLEEADFQALASAYVELHPSTFFSIRHYGDGLADFLATDTRYSKVSMLAELARWEWAMAAAFDAADAEPIGPDAFAGLAPEDWAQLSFHWSPSVQTVDLEWNVPQLWKAVTEQTDRPEPAVEPAPVTYLIWRTELQIYFRPLSRAEAAMMAAARAGETFGELCVLLCEHVDETEAALQAAGFLRGWVESGLLIDP